MAIPALQDIKVHFQGQCEGSKLFVLLKEAMFVQYREIYFTYLIRLCNYLKVCSL